MKIYDWIEESCVLTVLLRGGRRFDKAYGYHQSLFLQIDCLKDRLFDGWVVGGLQLIVKRPSHTRPKVK
jgi:hypothetical protein